MGDAKMKWDDKQKRWRGMYRGKRFTRSAKKLKGTNATDTKVAANRWFEREKAKLDVKLGEKPRRNEAENRAVLESLQMSLEGLEAVRNDPKVAPVIDRIKRNIREVERRLQGKSALPPIDRSLMNPLDISVQDVEKTAKRRAKEAFFPSTPENADSILSFTDHLRNGGKEKYEMYDNAELRSHLAFLINNPNPFATPIIDESVVDRTMPMGLTEEQWRTSAIDMILSYEIYQKIVIRMYGQSNVKTILEDETKEQIGAMQNDFDRGILVQKCNAGGLVVAADKSLSVHLKNFIAVQESRVGRGLIGNGELGQVVLRINHYRRWLESKGIDDAGALMEVQHANAYSDFLNERMKNKEIGPSYLNKLFATFRAFTTYLVGESVLPSYPTWMSRKDDRYKIKVTYGSPETIPLDHLRILYKFASSELRLFMLLVLNCGCGQAEAGRLKRQEYKAVEGKIVHQRSKTKRYDTPEVHYRLWKRTKELLDRRLETQRSSPKIKEYENILIVNEKGCPYWRDWHDSKGYHKYDAISPMFEDLVEKIREQDACFPKYTFYQFRKTSATAIGNHKEFSRLDWFFLGHAPKTTAGQHYVKLATDTLDDCLAWLETFLFESEVVQ